MLFDGAGASKSLECVRRVAHLMLRNSSSGIRRGEKLMLKAIIVAVSAVGLTGVLSTAPTSASAQVAEKTERAAKKTGEVITDSAITTEVKTKLLAAKGVPGSKIEVDTTNGIVTLTGVVPTRASRTKAVRITRHSKGVKQVVDQLKIGNS
jgi:hyperosmotically inducible protein